MIKSIILFVLLCCQQFFSQNNFDELTHVTSVSNSYPNWSPDGSMIVFHSDRLDNNYEIYMMNNDGTNLVRLTNNPSYDLTPVWSPDGEKIAFQSSRDGNEEIYIMNTDGSYQRNITHYPGEDMHPKWSGNNKIMFSSIRGYWNLVDIYEINIDGTGLERITRSVEIDTYAERSPGGSKILTRRIIAGTPNSEIFLLNSDGSNPVNMTNDPAFDGWPSWHPGGTKITFATEDENEVGSIYEMTIGSNSKTLLFESPGSWAVPIWNRDGLSMVMTRTLNGNTDIFTLNVGDSGQHEPVKLTNVQDKYPNVSSDESKIVFQSNRAGNWQIFTINTDGTNLKRLTNNSSNDEHPSWSADESQIVFVSDRDGNSEIYVMNADGTNQKNISNHPAEDRHPNWSPDGKKIIFNSSRNEEKELSIFVMNSDGSNVKSLSKPEDKEIESYASFSPNGSKIVFVKWFENSNGEIFVMNSDGTIPVNVTNNPAFDGYPCWSPDGKSILFSSNRSGKYKLFTINIDGNELKPFLQSPFDEHQIRAHWSINGSTAVFNTQSNGTIDIYLKKIHDKIAN